MLRDAGTVTYLSIDDTVKATYGSAKHVAGYEYRGRRARVHVAKLEKGVSGRAQVHALVLAADLGHHDDCWTEELMKVHPGRFTADMEGDFVVFLIGMRFNHPLRIRKWLPVVTAMPQMLKVISQHPELGCLGAQQWFGRTTLLLQYWRDFQSLDRFAKDSTLPHLEAIMDSAVEGDSCEFTEDRVAR